VKKVKTGMFNTTFIFVFVYVINCRSLQQRKKSAMGIAAHDIQPRFEPKNFYSIKIVLLTATDTVKEWKVRRNPTSYTIPNKLHATHTIYKIKFVNLF